MEIARAKSISTYIAGAAQPFQARPAGAPSGDPAAVRLPAGNGELLSFVQRLNDAAVVGATPRGRPRGLAG